MITRRQPPVKQKTQSFLHCRKIAENRRKTQKRCKFNLHGQQNDLEWLPLRFSHVQRKNYFKFRVCRALRSAPNAIFTGGVVKGNCICSAAFCESAALGRRTLSVKAYGFASSPEGEAFLRRWEGFSLHLKLQQRALRLGSPFGGAGAGAPERACSPLGELSRSD